MYKAFVAFVILSAGFCGWGTDLVQAQDSQLAAQSTVQADISIDQLNLILKPLRRDQLKIEVEGWLALLQAKADQIAQTEIAVHQLNEAPEAQADGDGAAGQEQAEAQAQEKEKKLELLAKLRQEQSGLVDRCSVAVEAYKAKGGDVTEYDQYIEVVSGIQLDVKDVSATQSLVINWLTSPEGGIRWGWRILSFIVIVIAFKILASFLGQMTRHAMKMNKKSSDLLKEFFSHSVSKITIIIGFVVALSVLGINIGPLVAGIGAVGFIVGFALQGTLNNLAAGIMILLYRPYDVGDVITAAGITGVVDSMNLNTTTIKTFDNQIMVVPNGSIWGGNITNATGSATRRIDMTFGISYTDDIDKAQAILEKIVNDHKLVLDEPEAVIRMHELADSSVNFICRPWTKTSDYWTVYWDITRAVKDQFDAAKISIPFPQRDVHLYNEAPSA